MNIWQNGRPRQSCCVCRRPCSYFPSIRGPERVLVVHSYGTDFQWTRELDEGIRSVLHSDPADYRIVFTEYLHAKPHNSAEAVSVTETIDLAVGLFPEGSL